MGTPGKDSRALLPTNKALFMLWKDIPRVHQPLGINQGFDSSHQVQSISVLLAHESTFANAHPVLIVQILTARWPGKRCRNSSLPVWAVLLRHPDHPSALHANCRRRHVRTRSLGSSFRPLNLAQPSPFPEMRKWALSHRQSAFLCRYAPDGWFPALHALPARDSTVALRLCRSKSRPHQPLGRTPRPPSMWTPARDGRYHETRRTAVRHTTIRRVFRCPAKSFPS